MQRLSLPCTKIWHTLIEWIFIWFQCCFLFIFRYYPSYFARKSVFSNARIKSADQLTHLLGLISNSDAHCLEIITDILLRPNSSNVANFCSQAGWPWSYLVVNISHIFLVAWIVLIRYAPADKSNIPIFPTKILNNEFHIALFHQTLSEEIMLIWLTLCMLGNFACIFVDCWFFQNQYFPKISFKNNIRVSKSFDPDQAQGIVRLGVRTVCKRYKQMTPVD